MLKSLRQGCVLVQIGEGTRKNCADLKVFKNAEASITDFFVLCDSEETPEVSCRDWK